MQCPLAIGVSPEEALEVSLKQNLKSVQRQAHQFRGSAEHQPGAELDVSPWAALDVSRGGSTGCQSVQHWTSVWMQ